MEAQKTLKIIQVLAKIGKILSKIIQILCIVGASLCLVGAVVFAIWGNVLFDGDGFKIYGLIQDKIGVSGELIIGLTVTGAIACVGEAILSGFAVRYFKNELQAGTPFTLAGSKELLRLGILAITIPIAISIAVSITLAIAAAVTNSSDALENFKGWSFSIPGLGIMMIVSSLLCRYGALQEAKRLEAAPGTEQTGAES